MAFNELNSVDYFIIHQLTGVNLNQVQHGMVKEEPLPYGDAPKWNYVQPELLPRDSTDVFIEKELKESLIRLNPAIKQNPERAEEVIHKLRAILIAVGNVGLVRANEELSKGLRGEISMPIGKNNEHVHVSGINQEMEEVVLDAGIIDNLMNNKNPKDAEKVIKMVPGRLGNHKGILLRKAFARHALRHTTDAR